MSTRSFLATAQHNLRAPLNTIIGFSEMLGGDARAAGNASLAADLERINAAGKDLHLMLIAFLEAVEQQMDELEGGPRVVERGPLEDE